MVIADTGFWVALGNSRDKYHEIATQKFIALSDHGETFVTTWPVMTETCHLLLHRIGHMAQVKFIENYHQGAFEVFQLGFDHAGQIHALMKKYADLPMDLADASLVLLAEHLGHGRILSTDLRDFRTYRWKQHQPFQNLLLP
jgi:predicted nucleic acid-binding protein